MIVSPDCPADQTLDIAANLQRSPVPRCVTNRSLSCLFHRLGISTESVLHLSNEVIVASGDAQYTIEPFELVKRSHHHRLTRGEILSPLDRAAVVDEIVIGHPGQHANIELRRILGQSRVRLRPEIVHIREVLYAEPRRLQPHQNPVPFRTRSRYKADQLLIEQPCLDSSEIA